MIEYSEYSELADILARTDHETTYQDLMEKEEKVLDTVNSVVKYYQEKKRDKTEFVKMNIIDIINLFFTEWSLMIADISKINKGTLKFNTNLLLKNDRLIYIGLMLVMIAVIVSIIAATS